MKAARPASASPQPGPIRAAADPDAAPFATLDETSDNSSPEECASDDCEGEDMSEDGEVAEEDPPHAGCDVSIATARNQNRFPIANFARECDRYGVSDRAAAALATALLVDLNLVINDNDENVVTRNKVRRARDSWRGEIFFIYKFSSNVCLGGFAGSEPSLSIACCAGPDPTTRSRNSSAMAEFYPNV